MISELVLVQDRNRVIGLSDNVEIKIDLGYPVAIPNRRGPDVHVDGVPRVIRIELNNPPFIGRNQSHEPGSEETRRFASSFHDRIRSSVQPDSVLILAQQLCVELPVETIWPLPHVDVYQFHQNSQDDHIHTTSSSQAIGLSHGRLS